MIFFLYLGLNKEDFSLCTLHIFLNLTGISYDDKYFLFYNFNFIYIFIFIL